jgi:hypothetical protein
MKLLAMKKIKILFLSIVLIAIHHYALGVMAYPYPVEITQPDGTKITIVLKGDEHLKWAETIDGYSILRNSKGIYEYEYFRDRSNWYGESFSDNRIQKTCLHSHGVY